MSFTVGPQPDMFRRPYIEAGHAPLSAPADREPGIPGNTPLGHEAVPAGAADPGASPIDTIRIDGQPSTPLVPTLHTVPGQSGVNVFESAAAAPPVSIAHLNLADAAGHQTSAMRAAPDCLPRSPAVGTHIAPTGVNAEPRP